MMSACFLAVSLLSLSAHWWAVTPWPAVVFPVLILGFAQLQKDVLVRVLGKDSWTALLWPFLCLHGSSVGSGHPSWHIKDHRTGTPWIAVVVTLGIWEFDRQKRMILVPLPTHCFLNCLLSIFRKTWRQSEDEWPRREERKKNDFPAEEEGKTLKPKRKGCGEWGETWAGRRGWGRRHWQVVGLLGSLKPLL